MHFRRLAISCIPLSAYEPIFQVSDSVRNVVEQDNLHASFCMLSALSGAAATFRHVSFPCRYMFLKGKTGCEFGFQRLRDSTSIFYDKGEEPRTRQKKIQIKASLTSLTHKKIQEKYAGQDAKKNFGEQPKWPMLAREQANGKTNAP